MYNNFLNVTMVNGRGNVGYQTKIGSTPEGNKYTPGLVPNSLRETLKKRNKVFIDSNTASRCITISKRKHTSLANKTVDKLLYVSLIPDQIICKVLINLKNLRTGNNTNRTIVDTDDKGRMKLIQKGIRMANKNSIQYNKIIEVYNEIKLAEFYKAINNEVKTLKPEAFKLLGFCKKTWEKATIRVCGKGFKDTITYIT